MKISEATPNKYTISIQMVVGLQKIGRRILEHLCKKDIREPPTKDSCRAAKEAACQIGPEVTAEAPTHSNLRTLFCGSKTDHRTKDCPIFLKSKRKMEHYSAKTSQQIGP
jgi:hypothetical protein